MRGVFPWSVDEQEQTGTPTFARVDAHLLDVGTRLVGEVAVEAIQNVLHKAVCAAQNHVRNWWDIEVGSQNGGQHLLIGERAC